MKENGTSRVILVIISKKIKSFYRQVDWSCPGHFEEVSLVYAINGRRNNDLQVGAGRSFFIWRSWPAKLFYFMQTGFIFGAK